MLTKSDLGFLFPYLALSLVLVVSVIGFVIRRKWRLSVARAEEVRRLVVLAAEESARFELEAYSAAYVAPIEAPDCSMPVIYHQCAVCFNPSTTRCSRCKAVRYCSGKCQIIHWRQGHKHECQPFTTIYQNNYTGEIPSQRCLEQGNDIYGNDGENEGRHYVRHVQGTPEVFPLSKSGSQPEVICKNEESEVEHRHDSGKKNSSFHVSARADTLQSAYALPAKLESDHAMNMKQNGVTCLANPGDIESGCARSATMTTSSSGSSVDGSIDSLFFEPSTSSSGFWDGTLNSKKIILGAHDDSSQLSSSDAGDAEKLTAQSSKKIGFNFSLNNLPPLDVPNSYPKIVAPEDAQSPNLGMKKVISRAALSHEKIEDASGRKGMPFPVPENSDCVNVRLSKDSPVFKDKDPQSCTPIITPKSNRLASPSPDRSNGNVGETSSTLRSLESKDNGSVTTSVSIARSSTTRTSSAEVAKSLKVANAHASLASSDYANHSLNVMNDLKTPTFKVVDNLKISKRSSQLHSAAGGEVVGRYTNKGLFSYDAFVKLYNWNKVDMRPCGLTNCGNSCYANAVLQCLAWTPPLTAYLLQGLHGKACEKKEWCFTCEFQSVLMKAREGISPLSPSRILSEIQKIGSRLGNGREEDAHEFLRYAIDNMQSVCLKEAQVSEPNSLEEETTLIGLTFGGYLRSKIKCMRCGGKSERHERMMDLTVEIEGDIGTLEAALQRFTGTEVLDGENKYQCSRCRSYEKAKKKLKVQEAPNVLTIALKRFQSGKFGKLNKSILFPDILDLAPYMSGTSDKSPIYKLYGVVVHLDVMNATFSGHYVCYVKNYQNKWFKVDDSVVTAVERADVLSRRAYMLLYARCSPRAPRLIRNSITPSDPKKPQNPLVKLRSLSRGPWDEPSNGHTGSSCLYPNHSNFHHNRRILEDDSSSENSSSLFSEACSFSTESSNRDSSSTDEFFDHLFGDTDQNWNTMWKRSSDSDTSSSSSSSSSPTPLCTKRSPLSNSDKYSSRVQSVGPEKDDSFRVRTVPSLYSCKLDSSSSSNSCRETDSEKVGLANILGSDKSGLTFRKSTRERRD